MAATIAPEEQNKKHLFCGKALAFWLYPGTAQIAKAFFFFFPAVCFFCLESASGGQGASVLSVGFYGHLRASGWFAFR